MLKTIELKAAVEKFSVLTDWLREIISSENLDNSVLNKINICLEEVFVNIASYAYNGGVGPVKVSAGRNEKEIILKFEDEGIEYDPLMKDDPDITLPYEKRPIGGLGIFMVKEMSKNIEYERKDNKNILTITFSID